MLGCDMSEEKKVLAEIALLAQSIDSILSSEPTAEQPTTAAVTTVVSSSSLPLRSEDSFVLCTSSEREHLHRMQCISSINTRLERVKRMLDIKREGDELQLPQHGLYLLVDEVYRVCEVLHELDSDKYRLTSALISMNDGLKDRDAHTKEEESAFQEVEEEVGEVEEYISDCQQFGQALTSNIGQLESATKLASEIDTLKDIQEKVDRNITLDSNAVNSLLVGVEANEKVLRSNIAALRARLEAVSK